MHTSACLPSGVCVRWAQCVWFGHSYLVLSGSTGYYRSNEFEVRGLSVYSFILIPSEGRVYLLCISFKQKWKFTLIFRRDVPTLYRGLTCDMEVIFVLCPPSASRANASEEGLQGVLLLQCVTDCSFASLLGWVPVKWLYYLMLFHLPSPSLGVSAAISPVGCRFVILWLCFLFRLLT